jgi:nitroimidazol reductase NimA-like FMN-containing flavoprotein (pyridoxamine 5'-phosphate oxidase superfamily)
MMKTIRREDRKISESEAIEIVQKGEYGVLSMCTPDHEGYGIPLHYALWNNAIYFHCATEGSKLDYLRLNNKVSFCVVGKYEVLPSKFATIYESALVFGITSEVEGAEKQDALMRILEKYSNNYMQEGEKEIIKFFDAVKVIKLSIQSITGKARKH